MKKNIVITSIVLLILFFSNSFAWTKDFWFKMGLFVAVAEVFLRIAGPLLNAVIFTKYFDLPVVKKKPLTFMLLIGLFAALTNSFVTLIIIVLAILLYKSFQIKDKKKRYLSVALLVLIVGVCIWAAYSYINSILQVVKASSL